MYFMSNIVIYRWILPVSGICIALIFFNIPAQELTSSHLYLMPSGLRVTSRDVQLNKNGSREQQKF